MAGILCKSIREDLKGRLGHYRSDWVDGVAFWKELLAPTIYVFLMSVLPAIAFGQQLSNETESVFGISHVLAVTAAAGIIQSFLGGQPLLIIGVAEPIVILYAFMFQLVKEDEQVGKDRFRGWCCWVLVWTSLMCAALSILGATRLILYFTRYAGEIFGLLIAVLFMQQAVLGTIHEFNGPEGSLVNGLWSVIVVFGLPLTAQALLRLRRSTLFVKPVRDILSDYAAILMVIFWSVLTAVLPLAGLIHHIQATPPWQATPGLSSWGGGVVVEMADIPVSRIAMALGPAVVITILFFFDHTVSSQLAQTGHDVVVQKPPAYAYDLFVLAVVTAASGLAGMPPVNGVIPQAPLHARQLRGLRKHSTVEYEDETEHATSALEPRVNDIIPQTARSLRSLSKTTAAQDQETTKQAITVLEQRVSNLGQSLLIAGCVPLVQYLSFVPRSVLWGYFAFMSIESLPGNTLVERLILIVSDLSICPNQWNDLPYRHVAAFTIIQGLIVVAIWALIYFGGIGGLSFPIPILLVLPFRALILPRIFGHTTVTRLDPADYESTKQQLSEADDTEFGQPEFGQPGQVKCRKCLFSWF